jgi:hypothetical protein
MIPSGNMPYAFPEAGFSSAGKASLLLIVLKIDMPYASWMADPPRLGNQLMWRCFLWPDCWVIDAFVHRFASHSTHRRP